MQHVWPLAKSLLKRIRFARVAANAYRNRAIRRQLSRRTAEQVFTELYLSNAWGSAHSRSGPGSEVELTAGFRDRLPALWRELGVGTVVDVPCGDFAWMSRVDLSSVSYIGADIVAQIIDRNAREHARAGVRFEMADLINGYCPSADLVFCRDCLVHFSFKDIEKALTHIKRSGAKWLMTTHFPECPDNVDIATGQWRPLNLCRPPFGFSSARTVIQEIPHTLYVALGEKWTSLDPNRVAWLGQWRDKSLGVWSTDHLP